ncbi:PREDICTED: homeobox-leucine zipper protein HAT14-like [Nelumbo nucifera]|uniref:Homeobox-leucine zipper protein HAT14-like n=2 Tax=Nelumbo nucifera TaxID=4432 RepID=A0A1U7ZU71_NELNU|nr:PREDICTED: homeobox-leucine zipper protein HAT14-like [Nelumbo nucifera]DAD43364.1 TPA_asm: hypothetical protein HUJ06_001594 [Nelumbo nucifera]
MGTEKASRRLNLGEETKPKITIQSISDNRGLSRGEGRTRGLGIDMNKIPNESSDDSPNNGDEEGMTIAKRKKLRLTAHQTAILESCFKQQSTLSQKEKTELAKGLNLKPRQIEVWFQNRRARTKSKQTEMDFEYFKHCCETLTEENRRLHRELMELRALNRPPQLYMQVPATTTRLVVCSICKRDALPNSRQDRVVPKLSTKVVPFQVHGHTGM